MSNRFVEGFATYGTGRSENSGSLTDMGKALLAGRWADIFNGGQANANISGLPWAPADTDMYLNAGGSFNYSCRVVMPVGMDPFIMSLYYAMSQLPVTSGGCMVCDVRNNLNQIMAQLRVLSTGAMALYNGASVMIASSSGPVLTAESAAHLEFELSPTGGTFQLQVNGTTVINAGGLTFTNAAQVAQVGFFFSSDPTVDNNVEIYIGNLICRDTTGTVNNAILGDRRVATLFVNSDDPAHQGWTGRPLRHYSTGILDNTGFTSGQQQNAGNNIGVSTTPTGQTDIGNQQFTIEGSFRFQVLPTGSNKATLFGKWDLPNNHMSYELYVGGPSLELGNTVFRITTNGQTSTLVELISWPYQYTVGEWYHIAVARDGSNNTRLFVNGILQGLPVADANTYYSGGSSGAFASLGVEMTNGGNTQSNTSLNGWADEFRLTIGACRYTANFGPPTAPFPRGAIADPLWANVVWLSGFDANAIADDSGYGRLLSGINGAAAETPNDGQYNYQTMDKPTPNDNTFIEASLMAADGVLTYSNLPTATKTVTVATTNGTTPAVYTWVTALTAAFQVLIGANVASSMSNLAAAINAGVGAGVVYGTGTTANNDASANVLPSNQLEVVANVPGSVGNSLATTTNDPNAAWSGATMSGGADIPAYSQFGWSRLPSNTTIADSLTILQRTWKTDAGTCTVQASLIGGAGGVVNGAIYSITTAPTFYSDLIEHDPDNTSAPLTPTAVLLSKVRVNRLT